MHFWRGVGAGVNCKEEAVFYFHRFWRIEKEEFIVSYIWNYKSECEKAVLGLSKLFSRKPLKDPVQVDLFRGLLKMITFGLAGGLKTLTPHGLLKCAIYTNYECTYIKYPGDDNCITTTQCCTSVKVWVYPNLWSKLCNIETENKTMHGCLEKCDWHNGVVGDGAGQQLFSRTRKFVNRKILEYWSFDLKDDVVTTLVTVVSYKQVYLERCCYPDAGAEKK